MDNELLILMLDALRLEIRNLTLQGITANAIRSGAMGNQNLDNALGESLALRERSDQQARTALGNRR